MRIGQTSFISFSSNLLASVAGFVATIIFARLLGAEILGSYYLLLSLVAWLSLTGSMGIGSAITKRMSEGEDIGEYKLGGGLVIGLVCLLILTGLVAFQGVLESRFGIERLWFVVILLLVGLSGSYVDAMLKGAHLVHVSAVLKVGRRFSRTFLQVAGVLAGLGLFALVMGYAIGGLVLVVVGLYVVGGPFRQPERVHIERLFEYAKYAWVGRLEGKTFQQADIILLGYFTSSSLVGIYGITWNIANFLIIFSSSISDALFPELSKLSSEDRERAVASLVEDSLGYTGLVTIPGLVGGWLLRDRILLIYGDEFTRGAQVLVLLVLSVLFYGYQKQLTNALGGIDLPREAFKVNGVLIGSNIILNIILIYYLGMFGAAVASASSVLVSMLFGAYILKKYIDFSPPVSQILAQFISALIMGAILIALRFYIDRGAIQARNEIVAVVLVAVGATVYFTALYAISPDFRAVIRDNVPISL